MTDQPMSSDDGTTAMRQRLRAALSIAMKARDQLRVRALRDGLGAIDHAEAMSHTEQAPSAEPAGVIAGARAGLGATEVARRSLSTDQLRDIIGAQIAERLSAAADFDAAGVCDRATQLRDEAEVLRAFLED